jgi:hypothetical protein
MERKKKPDSRRNVMLAALLGGAGFLTLRNSHNSDTIESLLIKNTF